MTGWVCNACGLVMEPGPLAAELPPVSDTHWPVCPRCHSNQVGVMTKQNASITDMVPGDYVKVASGHYLEIAEVYGVFPDRLAKPSEGGFGVKTTDGRSVGMFEVRAYVKRSELA